ncbi:MAG: oxidoreductase [Thermoflexibacter sp.]|nr:oxidoreductase [Thermoflexibacter sp.]
MRKILVFITFSLIHWNILAQWTPQMVATKSNFRAVHTVNTKICWVGGSQGTFVKTNDGGKSWQVGKVANADSLDFRDVHAFDGNTAILMSAGEAEKGKAKIYKTNDGGQTWEIVFETQEKGVFLDGIAFWDRKNGIAFGDPIEGKFYVLTTKDGGQSWQRIPPERLPSVQDGEAAFAASGTAIVTAGQANAWIGTGGGSMGRVIYTQDRGMTWWVSPTPIKAGKSSGIFGLNFWNKDTGIAVGGDYLQIQDNSPNVSITYNGGRSWDILTTTKPSGLKEAVAIYGKNILIAVGNGTTYSKDFGKTWTQIDETIFHSLSFSGKTGFAVGAKGIICKFDDSILKE